MSEKKLKIIRISNKSGLERAEKEYRKPNSTEIINWAVNTPYIDIAEDIIKDKNSPWKTPLYMTVSEHNPSHGAFALCHMAEAYIDRTFGDSIDVLSISAYMKDKRLRLVILMRSYNDSIKEFIGFFKELGESVIEKDAQFTSVKGKLLVPKEIADFKYSDADIRKHDSDWIQQSKLYETCSESRPFLNSIDNYVPKKLPEPTDTTDLVYDLESADRKLNIVSTYEQFTEVFREIMMRLSSGTDKYEYFAVLKGEKDKNSFVAYVEQVIEDEYIKTGRLRYEDVPAMQFKLNKALFQLYVLQDLIDDPDITDIKVTAPDSIRVRIKGKAYISNVTFIDGADYNRFIDALAIRNMISLTVPSQTFTDNNDENYLMRFSITAEYATSESWPYLHIRKINRKKLLGNDLIKLGMFDEKVRDYLLDCARTSRGVVFAGPPGSGKTVALNWFLEEGYEQSAEILVIQENDELFAYRKGVMFEHVVNYTDGINLPVDLEGLGKMALVAGANVFIIGEAKGAEICSAITLSNSGCRTAITIHSPSSTETIDKMADLAQRGYAQSYEQAKRMLKSFQTIVYMQDFKVQEISEIVGYNEETHDMEYKYIYRRGA